MPSFTVPSDPEGLVRALGVRLHAYRQRRSRQSWRSRWRWRALRSDLRLFERAPLSLLPGVSLRSGTLAQILEETSRGDLWHLQVRRRRRRLLKPDLWLPRHYARARFDRDTWNILWIGEAWLAWDVHRAILQLDRDEARFAEDAAVRVVSSQAYEFSSLWIGEADQHLVASASEEASQVLTVGSYLSGDELQHRLVECFGDRFEVEGIGGCPGG